MLPTQTWHHTRKSFKYIIDLHCLIPPKLGKFMIPDLGDFHMMIGGFLQCPNYAFKDDPKCLNASFHSPFRDCLNGCLVTCDLESSILYKLSNKTER